VHPVDDSVTHPIFLWHAELVPGTVNHFLAGQDKM